MHFLPEKNAKDFQPPTACIFHESSGFLVTAVGKTLLKYDICTGAFVSAFPTISASDVTAIAQDGMRGTYVRTLCACTVCAHVQYVHEYRHKHVL